MHRIPIFSKTHSKRLLNDLLDEVSSSLRVGSVIQANVGSRAFEQAQIQGIPQAQMDEFIMEQIGQHRVKMFSAKSMKSMPLNTFPYKSGEYAIDDKNTGEEWQGFVRNAYASDPLSKMHGKRSHIGQHVSILATPERYNIILYKNVPPRALKKLCTQIKKHIASLPKIAHVELFREVGHEYKLVLSADRIRQIGLARLARVLVSFLQKKKRGHYVHYVLLQTIPGGSLHNYMGI